MEGANCSYSDLKRLKIIMATRDIAQTSRIEATAFLGVATDSERGASYFESWIRNVLVCKLTDEELRHLSSTLGESYTKTCCHDP